MQVRALLCCTVALLPFAAFAADQPGATNLVAAAAETNQLETVVVSATRLTTDPQRSPTSISVITAQEIAQTQLRTVADVLREQAGAVVTRNGSPGGQSSVFLRGANSNQTLLLVDGIRVNNGFNNAFDFAGLPVDNIDHIEILYGPQSTLYGSEAMGGVINIVTKQGAPKPTASATFEAGSHESWHPSASFALTDGKLSLAGQGSYFITENDRINSDFYTWNGSAHASYQALERLKISLLGTYLKSEAGVPNDKFTNDPNDFLHRENSLIGGIIEGEPTEWWEVKLTLSHNHDRDFFSGKAPNPPFFFGDFTELTKVDRDQVDLQNTFHIGTQHRLVLGGTFDDVAAQDVSSLAKIDQSVIDKALYGLYEFTPITALTLNAGGRLDDYSTFGTKATWRTGARYTIDASQTILRATVGTSFRAPTPRDLTPPFGNADLHAEQSLGWDAGLEQPVFDGKLRLGARYFQNNFDDLVVSVPAGPPFFSQLANAGRAHTLGIESFAAWTPLTNLTLRGSYTWLDAQDDEANKRLIHRPEHSGSLSANYRFLERFEANLNSTLVGGRPDYNFSTFPAKRVRNSGYVLLNTGLACDVCQHFTVFGRIENLLDDQYEEVFGFPSLGRTFWAGGTLRF